MYSPRRIRRWRGRRRKAQPAAAATTRTTSSGESGRRDATMTSARAHYWAIAPSSPLHRAAPGAQLRQHLAGGGRDVGARTEDGGDAGGAEHVVVLRGDHPAADHHHVAAPGTPQLLDELR